MCVGYPASEASYGIGSREGENSPVSHATPPWGWQLGKQKLVEWTQGIALYVWSRLEVAWVMIHDSWLITVELSLG